MIAAIDLKKYFGAVAAVDGVTFTARDGQVTGLLGPNGAGKTTTLRMLYGVMRPDAGTIEVDHIDATKHPRDAQARLGVLPDVAGLYPRLTAREQVRYYGELHGLDGDELEERTTELLRSLDLMHLADRRVGRLLARRAHQGGHRARAGARAAERAARRADQRPRRDEHPRGAHDHPPAQGRRAVRPVLQPRHAGSVGALRLRSW